MTDTDNLKEAIIVLPSAKTSDERENALFHTPYEIEKAFYSSIKEGNVTKMKIQAQKLLESKITVGKMSDDKLRQVQYWAVCCIAVAMRYAIDGGAKERTAYNFADECILKIDKMRNEEEIIAFLLKKSEELTAIVNESKTAGYPYAVKKCLNVIDARLFERLNLRLVAESVGMSQDHLSKLFKAHIGMGIPDYIKKERLSAAREMLRSGMKISQAAYTVGFGSESYFIKCYREAYGKTPGQEKENCPS
ncbi:MAG: helix-turn-helix domain-containing protein [Acutalibacteraceae bacterium]